MKATGYEHTAFLANWALSANLETLIPSDELKKSDTAYRCKLEEPTLIVGDDGNFAGRLLAAKFTEATVVALGNHATAWLVAADAEGKAAAKAGKNGKNVNQESGVIGSFTVAQSLVTQTLDLLKYFRTDTEFKDATVSLPTYALRSAVALKCPGARLPEMAAPTQSDLLTRYATLLTAGERIRVRTSDASSKGMSAGLKSDGLSIVASIDALKTQVSAVTSGKVPALVEAAQLLAVADARRLLTVRVMDQGGTVYRRSNLFFLSPKISYLAAVSVDYVLNDLSTGEVLWHKTMQVKTQMNQKFAGWPEKKTTSLKPTATIVQ